MNLGPPWFTGRGLLGELALEVGDLANDGGAFAMKRTRHPVVLQAMRSQSSALHAAMSLHELLPRIRLVLDALEGRVDGAERKPELGELLLSPSLEPASKHGDTS